MAAASTAAPLPRLYYQPDDTILYVVDVIAQGPTFWQFAARRVEACPGSIDGAAKTLKPYVYGKITHDGDSQLYFGDYGCHGSLHLAGVAEWQQHCAFMAWLYQESARHIAAFDPAQRWDERMLVGG